MTNLERFREVREKHNSAQSSVDVKQSELRRAQAEAELAARKLDEMMHRALAEYVRNDQDGAVVLDDLAVVQFWHNGDDGLTKITAVLPAVILDDEV